MTTIATTIASWIRVEITNARLRVVEDLTPPGQVDRAEVAHRVAPFAAIAADHVAEQIGQGRHLRPEADHRSGRPGRIEQRLGSVPG